MLQAHLKDWTFLNITETTAGANPEVSIHVSGMGRYKPVRQVLDILVYKDALELVLQKTPAISDSHGNAGWLTKMQSSCISRKGYLSCHYNPLCGHAVKRHCT